MKYKLTMQEKLKDLRIERGLTETRQPSPLSTGSLRISDDAVKALQDGKYNPLLLSEILTDENFLRLMVGRNLCGRERDNAVPHAG